MTTPDRSPRRAARGGPAGLAAHIACPLAVALLWALALRNGIGGDFFYDEAVYANLGQHPFRSDYYPDPVFFRHPPFVYLFYFLLTRLATGGSTEILLRTASLVAVSIGLVFLWLALSLTVRSWALRSAALLALSTSSLFVRYSLSATMYPYAFLFLAMALHGVARRNAREGMLGFILVSYAHLFGQVVLGLHFLAQFLRGKDRATLVPEHRVLFRGLAPLALLTLAQIIYSVPRASVTNLPGGYQALAFYVPVVIWPGMIVALAPVLRSRRFPASPVLGLALLSSLAFLCISTVAPPFERYLYFFLPLFLVYGTHGLDEACAWIDKVAVRRLVLATLALLFFVPAQVFHETEMATFANAVADNNRYGDWRPVVAACAGRSVLTNNLPSYLYYLAERDGTRYRLQDLEAAGLARRFDEQVEDLNVQLEAQHPDCVAVDRHLVLPSIVKAVEARRECTVVDPSAVTLLFRCRFDP